MENILQKLYARNGLLGIAEAAAILGVHEVTLRNWVRTARLPAIRLSGRWKIDAAELAGYLEKRRTG
jgi:excisionase family DNA binding protein